MSLFRVFFCSVFWVVLVLVLGVVFFFLCLWMLIFCPVWFMSLVIVGLLSLFYLVVFVCTLLSIRFG